MNRARTRAQAAGLPYAGDIAPEEAWQLLEEGAAVLVDVRTLEEYRFAGHVPGSLLIPWMTGIAMERNPDFVAEAEKRLDKAFPVLLLCRSAGRSVAAAKALANAGFMEVFNVLEGFEGERDANGQRNRINGWRFRNLPWVQD